MKAGEYQQGLEEALVHRGSLQWPRNLSGREYNGMNALMLMLHCEKEGYTIPRFCTFDLRAETEQTGQERRGTAKVSVLKRREIVSRHADHIYLHPQGDQGEDQV